MAENVLTIEAAKKANFTFREEGGVASQAVHDVITAMRANRRSGTANTKTRGEVADSGKKPFRQKGTGNARQGGNASPIHRGGGIVFGPRPRDYSKQVNRKTKRLAFAAVLEDRIASGDVLAVDGFDVADGKTKSFVQQVNTIAGTDKVLIIADDFSDKTYLAARNVRPAQLITVGEVNTEQLLAHDKLVVTSGALEGLAKRTAV